MTAEWEKIASAKRELVLAKIPPKWRLDPLPDVRSVVQYLDLELKDKNYITDLSAVDLATKIATGDLSSIEVVTAFAHRAAIAHQLTTCCSEIFFESAFERAEKLDQYLRENGKTVGPLHGVPISLKDQVNLEGIDLAMGYVSLLNQPKTQEEVSLIAKILYDAGAVFFVKTTTPMAMMSSATVSNIYGYTWNAHNKELSSGGSSGGEGTLLAAKGSPLGLGTDLGGSIRIPSAFNGLYGLRPCSNRLPYFNVTNSYANAPIICSVIGPMARDIGSLRLTMEVVLQAEPWLEDAKVPPIPWRSVKPKSTLKFGIVHGNGAAKLHPPIERALALTEKALEAKGHQLVEFEHPVGLLEARKLAAKIFGADGYKEMLDECAKSGEPLVKEVLSLAGAVKDPPKPVENVNQYWELAEKKYLSQQAGDAYWRKLGVDALILPVWESCSFRPSDLALFSRTYTSICNLMDWTSVTVPVTTADREIDVIDEQYVAKNELDEVIQRYYDRDLYHGMPVALQVVTPRYTEELVLEIAEVVVKALAGEGLK